MANNKQRYINTRFWNDNFVSELDPVEKLMFIYLLTNEHTNIAGVYELPLKIMGVETGFETSMIKKILPRLKSKVQYISGMVVIRNFVKHQETTSDKVRMGISNCLRELDKDFLKNIVTKGYYLLPQHYLDTLSIPYTYPSNYLDSNLDSNLDTQSAETSSAVPQIIKLFEEINPNYEEWYKNTTQRKAISTLLDRVGFEKLERVIKALPSITSQKAAPRITTPFELKRDWAKLGIFINQQKGAKKEILI